MHKQSLTSLAFFFLIVTVFASPKKYNVLFIISDDLTSTALSCYGNKVCKTPNIDAISARGTRFTRAYCQATYCGPSRASFMSGYYPHATGLLGYKSPRPRIGNKSTWSQYFKNNGYHSARVSKIYHMGVPGDIEQGGHGADDDVSWTERFNSPGPEWKALGQGETLESNLDGERPVVGGNTFVVVEAEGGDLVHSDGKTAAKACELLAKYAKQEKPFFLGVGFVRPHVPFVAPEKYYPPFLPYSKMELPRKIKKDWDDIPKAGINYKNSENMKMDVRRQKKAVGGYYASVSFMDAQVGKVMAALKKTGLEDETIVIFTSDHGYHLGEHDFWAKVSLLDESSQVPLIIKVPGKKPGVCHSLTELLDLYPTVSALCGLPSQSRLQGKDISKMLDDSKHTVRTAAFSVAPMRNGFLLRENEWSYIQYGENGGKGIELYNIKSDPHQYTNLAKNPVHRKTVDRFKSQMTNKLRNVSNNDLNRN